MKELEVLSQCERTGSRICRVKDSDQNIRVRLSGTAESVGGVDAEPPKDTPTYGVYNMSGELLGWKHTESAAIALSQDLTSLGVTCYPEQITVSPPESAS